jgi:hypothetical protein
MTDNIIAAPLPESNRERRITILQYARALNRSFIQGYCPGTVVLAQQLLLALSPLHAQLLPRPETAFLCPSSFRPAVGKALMAEITSRPLLDMFQHQEAHLTLWHVHWHIGLRRYAAAKRRQQQLGFGNGSSSSSAGDSIDAWYLDPDARCGFTTAHSCMYCNTCHFMWLQCLAFQGIAMQGAAVPPRIMLCTMSLVVLLCNTYVHEK